MDPLSVTGKNIGEITTLAGLSLGLLVGFDSTLVHAKGIDAAGNEPTTVAGPSIQAINNSQNWDGILTLAALSTTVIAGSLMAAHRIDREPSAEEIQQESFENSRVRRCAGRIED